MKKTVMTLLFLSFFIFSGAAQVAPPAAKAEDLAKTLVLVDKPSAAPDSLKAGFETISAKDSLALLTFIASDLMEGRETGTRGFQIAAEYAASLLGMWKLKPLGDVAPRAMTMAQMLGTSAAPARPAENTFFQEFALLETTEASSSMSLEIRRGGSVRTHAFRPVVDFQGVAPTGDSLSGPVVFAGYGIGAKDAGYDEFKNLDLAGRIVLVIADTPAFLPKEVKDKYAPLVSSMGPAPAGNRVDRIEEIHKRGAAAVLVVRAGVRDADRWRSLLPAKSVYDERPIIKKPYHGVALPGSIDELPWSRSAVVSITPAAADRILSAAGLKLEDLQAKIAADKKPASQEIPGAFVSITSTVKTQPVRGINVVAMLEGSDPKLKDEAVVIGAHLDHVGHWEDYIFNGADDNGSGSVGVLNLARAFAANAVRPKRTVVFCLWCGEEEGLLGSRYFVTNPPALLKAKIVSYINFDMMSRPYDEKSLAFASRMMGVPSGPEFLKKIKPANFILLSFPVGTSFAESIRTADQYVGLDVYLRETKQSGISFGDSDHTSFGDAKIPWVWPFSAVTEDLHQTSDSVDKVSGELMEKVSKLMYVVGWLTADK